MYPPSAPYLEGGFGVFAPIPEAQPANPSLRVFSIPVAQPAYTGLRDFPIKVPVAQPAVTELNGRIMIASNELETIKTQVMAWQAQNPGKLLAQTNAILEAIPNMETNPQLTGDSLRSWIQLSSDESTQTGLKALFNTAIYQQVSSDELSSLLVGALGFDPTLVPSTAKPAAPPFKPGYVAYVFKNLPDDTRVQVGAHLNGGPVIYYMTKIGDTFALTDDQNAYLKKSDLPTFVDPFHPEAPPQPYVYIPANMISGRIYYTSATASSLQGSAFTEFNMDQFGNPDVNFSAVDAMPQLTSDVQLSGNNQTTNRNGVQINQRQFFATMRVLYNKYDPTGVWSANMVAPDGGIRSGKHMGIETGTPVIQNALSDYLTQTFIPYFSENDLWFIPDAPLDNTPVRGRIYQTSEGGFEFRTFSPSTLTSVILPLPEADNINMWVSGAFGGAQDPIATAITWGMAKALSSIINKGILPQDVNSSEANPVNGKTYFTNIENVKNFYKAPWYNIFLRAMHEAGCTAYGADFDDYMGGDGSVGDDHTDQPAIIVTFSQLGQRGALEPSKRLNGVCCLALLVASAVGFVALRIIRFVGKLLACIAVGVLIAGEVIVDLLTLNLFK